MHQLPLLRQGACVYGIWPCVYGHFQTPTDGDERYVAEEGASCLLLAATPTIILIEPERIYLYYKMHSIFYLQLQVVQDISIFHHHLLAS
jgi:hypothetical protein